MVVVTESSVLLLIPGSKTVYLYYIVPFHLENLPPGKDAKKVVFQGWEGCIENDWDVTNNV